MERRKDGLEQFTLFGSDTLRLLGQLSVESFTIKEKTNQVGGDEPFTPIYSNILPYLPHR